MHSLKVYLHCLLLIDSLKYCFECSPSNNSPKKLCPQAASPSYAVVSGQTRWDLPGLQQLKGTHWSYNPWHSLYSEV